ncbi:MULTISPECIES: DUF6344 domain-containing protein [unclassified Streptomyces]|uniref:DUF6344 domain-containing protein n=1 Tax=unclassified Streptomyces TaxID=2593676 RepID=UPI0005A8575E|nr:MULTISPECIES: DUF6344 domain-containing protein [unclassified Streptomyces]ODA73490.1 hypothetical protein APS67_002396 [Streptomyces sp. AVP053U2]
MARNKVMKLWTALVTAFLALCTALGLVTTTASAAVPRSETTRNSENAPDVTAPTASTRPWSHAAALPPTMKQRIRAEAHGASPGCRSRRLTNPAPALDPTAPTNCSDDDTTSPAEPPRGHLPLQR